MSLCMSSTNAAELQEEAGRVSEKVRRVGSRTGVGGKRLSDPHTSHGGLTNNDFPGSYCNSFLQHAVVRHAQSVARSIGTSSIRTVGHPEESSKLLQFPLLLPV